MSENKVKKPIEHINIAELNHGQASKIVRDLSENGKTGFIQRNGKLIAVLISYETYQCLLEHGIDINDYNLRESDKNTNA